MEDCSERVFWMIKLMRECGVWKKCQISIFLYYIMFLPMRHKLVVCLLFFAVRVKNEEEL